MRPSHDNGPDAGGQRERLAAAPISWGVCEAPGWGYQLPPERVLGEMAGLGVAATEFGPDDFLPDDPAARAELLAAYGLRAVGGFLPLVLHDPGHDPLPRAVHTLERFRAAGADTLVVAADSAGSGAAAGYDERDVVDEPGWARLFANLDRIAEAAADRGVRATLHPHVGTVIENRAEVERVLRASMPLCLDTGHLLLGGTDPAELISAAADRIAHVHLKDVSAEVAARFRAGDEPFTESVRRGVFRPLGTGDIDIRRVVGQLEDFGYDGWYVLEQDRVLETEPGPNEGPAPDVRESLEFLAGVLRERTAGGAA